MNSKQDDFREILERVNSKIVNSNVYQSKIQTEEYVNIFGSRLEGHLKIGAHTFINPGSDVRHCVIGRYCSIGDGVYISPNRHPHDWFSTHPILLSKSERPYSELTPSFLERFLVMMSHPLIQKKKSLEQTLQMKLGEFETMFLPRK